MRVSLIISIVMVVFGGVSGAQQPNEISVSLKTPDGKYVGQVAGGGLDVTANAVTIKQTFGLIDFNSRFKPKTKSKIV